jgi:hypothetical protein
MRYFRRLPPLLRVASLLGLLFPLASLVLLIPLLVTSLPSFPNSPPDFGRRGIIALNLGMLGGACSIAVNAYSTRFRRPDRGPFPLNSWQSQVRAIVVVAVLPSCALALALVAPLIPLPLAFLLVAVAAISVLAAIVVRMATIWVPISASALD